MFLDEIIAEKRILTLYHGGRDLESDYLDIKPSANGRWEYGTGLYLTTDREIAQKYSGGSRKLYRVTVDLTNAHNIDDVVLDFDQAVDFVNRNVKKSVRSEFIELMTRSRDRVGVLRANVVSNLCLNLNALTSSRTVDLRNFLIQNGVDYAHVSGFGGRAHGQDVYVVINPKIIKRVERNKGD